MSEFKESIISDTPEDTPEDIPEYTPEDIPEDTSEYTPEDTSDDEINKVNETREPNEDQRAVLDYIEKSIQEDPNKPFQLLIQGSAGTGKSFLIYKIKDLLEKYEIKSITGSHQAIAAYIVEGLTLYKIFGFFGNREKSRVQKGDRKYELLKHCNKYQIVNVAEDITLIDERLNFDNVPTKNCLIIDEISMIGIEYLNDMDKVLQTLFRSNKPFGGINLVFCGHFSQLKPVKEVPIFNLNKDHFIKHVKLFELTINQRQKDQVFFNLCNGVMKGCLRSHEKKLLKSRLVQNFEYSKLVNLVHIYPTKKLCFEHNIRRLLDLNEDVYYFIKSTDFGNSKLLSKEEKYTFNGLSNYIICANNSKIMITANVDSYMNGEIYTIDEISLYNEMSESEFFINNDNTEEIKMIQRKILQKKKKIKYVYPNNITIKIMGSKQLSNNKEKGNKRNMPIGEKILKMTERKKIKTVFQRRMFPFQLAWAVTTHKIQGISLDEGVIDMGESNFDPVQLYVNISRLTSLEKLYIKELKLPLPVSPDKKLIKKFIEEIKKNNENNTVYQNEEEEEEEDNDNSDDCSSDDASIEKFY